TVAVLEPGMADEWDRLTMAGGRTLTGTKLLVPWADSASVVVVATLDGLYAVEDGFRTRRHRSIDHEPRFAVEFDRTPAVRLGADDHDALLRRMLDVTTVARLAEAVGAASRALEMTVQYAKDRHQF